MTIRPKRKAIPMRVQRDACLIALGLDPFDFHLHHEPPLVFRPLNPEGTDTDPPMNDPRHIIPMASQAHKDRTPRDLKTGAKVKRLERAQQEHNRHMRGQTLKEVYLELGRAMMKRRIPSRPFAKGHRKLGT